MMEELEKIKVGMVARLKGDCSWRYLTIESVDSFTIGCVWIVDGVVYRDSFPIDALICMDGIPD